MENSNIPFRLKKLMQHFFLNQALFCEKCGIGAPNFSAVLNGRRPLGHDVANRIVLACGVDKRWLLTGEGEMFPKSKVEEPTDTYGGKLLPDEKANISDTVKTLAESNLELTRSNSELIIIIKQVVDDNRELGKKMENLRSNKK